MLFFNYKKIRSAISTFLLITVLVSSFALTPLTPHGKIQEVSAQYPVLDVTNLVQTTLTAANSVVSLGLQNSLFVKEYFLDGIVNGLAKMVLKSMTQSILTWINSGFQGSPAFITDLKQFLLDSADQVAGDFIYNDPSLNFLCSPFQLDVKIALAVSYQEDAHGDFSEAQCTLSEVTDNIEGFLGGSFDEGGWASWFEVTQNPVNTPTGAFLAAEGELYARIADAEGNTVRELEWGQGFLSFKVCSEAQEASGAQKSCTITTPGTTIANQINKSLGAGQDALIAADEIDEIIGAFFAQIAKQAITGAAGLLGLGASAYADNSFGPAGNRSFLDELAAENPTIGGTSGRNPFKYSQSIEEENIELQTTIIAAIQTAEDKLATAKAAHEARIARQSGQNGSANRLAQNCFSLTTPQDLIDDKDDANINILISSSSIATLASLNVRYTTTEDPAEQLVVIETYNRMVSSGLITQPQDNTMLKIFIEGNFEDRITAFNASIASEISRCASGSTSGGGER